MSRCSLVLVSLSCAIFGITIPTASVQAATESDVLAPVSERFAQADVAEVPSLQRHVLPLMGRLGCNGRACHGSFQGQGGFRLSLFGYDFKADHEALTQGDSPRVDSKKPQASLILAKPTSADPDDHGGGKRMDVGSWQYRVLERWIAAGAPAVDAKDPKFVKLVVTPTEIVCRSVGDKTQLNVLAHWSNGLIEDVTPLCRFTTNDETVATVDLNGVVAANGKGDTHIVAFYDNGVVPVSLMLPVSDRTGLNFPEIAAKTKVDELVLAKLRKLGVVPAELSGDADFLRRVSLDVTGQLPSPDEVRAFLADTSADKRARKIDELLTRPAYAAWWTTKLCDVLGNSAFQLQGGMGLTDAERQWYRWLYRRVDENMPYDDIVEGMVLAVGRSSEGQTFAEYCAEMASYVRHDNPADFADRETMPLYWQRRNMRAANQKALGFSYSFLGVRLQCAECHKHPFDQWSQADFQDFTAFFTRITTGTVDKKAYDEMVAQIRKQTNKPTGDIGQQLRDLAAKGQPVPLSELYIAPAQRDVNRARTQDGSKGRVITPKVLGGDTTSGSQSQDPRQPLMDWLRQKDNPYFARAFVNRVWAHYFNVGIVEPADDMNLANAPSNKELLDYLAAAFVAHDYDIRWLMREITNSDAYQRSWEPNPTNERDLRNFARAVPRRLPAEVVYDAVVIATAGKSDCEARRQNPVEKCAIGLAFASTGGGNGNRNNDAAYAMTVFGKPKRETACDCERSNEPSLLQSVYLRNDKEMYRFIDRDDGWLAESLAVAGEASHDRELITEAYLRTFCRLPTETELTTTLDYVKTKPDRRAALSDVVWALLNSKEFVANH